MSSYNYQEITELQYDDYRHSMFKLDHCRLTIGETNWQVLVGSFGVFDISVMLTDMDDATNMEIAAGLMSAGHENTPYLAINQDNTEELNAYLFGRQISLAPTKHAAEEVLDRLIGLKDRVTPYNAKTIQEQLDTVSAIVHSCQEKIVDVYNIIDDWANNA